MNSKADPSQPSPDIQIQDVLSLLDSGKDPVSFGSHILSAIESSTSKVSKLLEIKELKNSYALLTSVQNLCLKILRKLASNPKSEFVASIKRALEAYDHYQNQSKKVYSSLETFLSILEAQANNISLREHKPNAEFYLTICFNLIQSVNNIGIVFYLSKKPDVAIRNFYCAAEIYRALERLVTPFQTFALTTILINVSLITESETTLDVIGKIVCGSILFLENFEEAIDRNEDDSARYYEKLRFHADLACVSEIEAKGSKKSADFLQSKSIITSRMTLLYNYYAKLLQDLGKQQEADFAENQAKLLSEQLEQQENQESERVYGKARSKLTADNVKKITEANADRQKGDAVSNFSVKTGVSLRTNTSEVGKLSKENIIYHKYVEAGAMKFKIVMAQIQELNSIQIIVYSKAKGLLKKIYLHFEDLIQFALKSDPNAMREEREFTKLLSGLAKMLYFKEGELFLREIRFFRTLEELAGTQQAAQ